MKKIFVLLFIYQLQVNAQCLWKEIDQGAYTTIGIKDDNTIWSWESGSQFQLSNPVQIGNDSNWSKLSAGMYHNLAIKSDGTLWAWGNNYFNQLGIPYNPNNNLSLPTQVGTDNDWIEISAGSTHSFAIKSNGTLWGWGYNDYGQLGNGTWVGISLPTQIGVDSDWKKVESKQRTTFAIKNNNTLWGWGNNESGQLGNGNSITINTPMQIGLNSSDWKLVRSGNSGHTIALKNDNTLWLWGRNDYGQLGNGTSISTYTPSQLGSSNDWKDILAGGGFSLALKTDNTLWAWGNNDYGQLGDGTLISKNTPIQIGSSNDWSKLIYNAGLTSFCIKSDKTLWGWGDNNYGKLLIGNYYNNTQGFTKIPNPTLITCSVVLSSESLIIQNKFKVFPNPASEIINIINPDNLTINKISIYNIRSEKIKEIISPTDQIEIMNLANGLYFIEVMCEKESFFIKFLKE